MYKHLVPPSIIVTFANSSTTSYTKCIQVAKGLGFWAARGGRGESRQGKKKNVLTGVPPIVLVVPDFMDTCIISTRTNW